MSGHYSRPLSCSSSESRPRRLKVVGVSLRSQLKGERLTNHTVSGDVESRPFTASIPNLLIARGSLSTRRIAGELQREFCSET